MKSVHDTYGRRQAYITVNHAALIAYLCAMTALGHDLRPDNFVHLCLTALLFGDAAFVSYRNMQNNRALNHFAYLLILLGWSFLLSLFAREPASAGWYARGLMRRPKLAAALCGASNEFCFFRKYRIIE